MKYEWIGEKLGVNNTIKIPCTKILKDLIKNIIQIVLFCVKF